MMHGMRTTVTLDPDTDAIVRRLMRERKLTFKQALNAAIRTGAGTGVRKTVSYTRTKNMGIPKVPLDKALQLAGQLEDEEIVRKLALGK
ncbi:MAG: antitoxin [Chloroflexi bacterium]|nr:antitoxin [Chloroflexota bacterium]